MVVKHLLSAEIPEHMQLLNVKEKVAGLEKSSTCQSAQTLPPSPLYSYLQNV